MCTLTSPSKLSECNLGQNSYDSPTSILGSGLRTIPFPLLNPKALEYHFKLSHTLSMKSRLHSSRKSSRRQLWAVKTLKKAFQFVK